MRKCNFLILNNVFSIGISDSLICNTLKPCEDYEVNGTSSFINCNGSKLSRINKQKLVIQIPNLNILLLFNVLN